AALDSEVAARPSEVLALDADEAALPSAATAASRAAIDSVFAAKACVNRLLIWSIRSPMFADTRAQSDSISVLLTIAPSFCIYGALPACVRSGQDETPYQVVRRGARAR